MMKQIAYWRRLVCYLIVALISAVSLSLASPASVTAQSVSEYFTISYAPASFSQNEIRGSAVFYVTIQGTANCTKDLPLSVSEASITSRIVARHIATSTVVTLNPSYTVVIKPFPSKKGDTIPMTQTISLQFPAQAPSGRYEISGELIEAKVKVLLIWLEVTSYLPPSQLIGSLEYTSPPSTGGVGGGGGGGIPPPSPTIETNLFGKTANFQTTATGKMLEKIEATSQDRLLGISIPQDTVALDRDGEPLKTLAATIKETPPAPPVDASIVGPVYDLGPDGTTFTPPITLTWRYNPGTLPPGIEEKYLFIAFRDGARWVGLESQGDTNANTVSARISHFTQFALIGKLPPLAPTTAGPSVPGPSISSLSVIPGEVNPTEPVTISTVVINTGNTSQSHTVVLKINGLEEARKKVDVGAGTGQKVDFTVTRSTAGTYQVSIDDQSSKFTVKTPVPATSVVETPLPATSVVETPLPATSVVETPPPATSVVETPLPATSVVETPLPATSVVETPLPATFAVSNLTITPTEAEPGEKITISVAITNTGALTGSQEVRFKVDDTVIATPTVTLAAGASQQVSIDTTKNAAGTYIVNVNGLSGTFTVKAAVINISAKPTNWWLVGGAIITCALIGMVTWLAARRRRRA